MMPCSTSPPFIHHPTPRKANFSPSSPPSDLTVHGSSSAAASASKTARKRSSFSIDSLLTNHNSNNASDSSDPCSAKRTNVTDAKITSQSSSSKNGSFYPHETNSPPSPPSSLINNGTSAYRSPNPYEKHTQVPTSPSISPAMPHMLSGSPIPNAIAAAQQAEYYHQIQSLYLRQMMASSPQFSANALIPPAHHYPHHPHQMPFIPAAAAMQMYGHAGLLFAAHAKPKRIRTAFTPTQLLKLEQVFERNQYVVGAERKQLAQSLNLSETQIKVWFQNRRTKHKRDKQEEGDGSSSPNGSSTDNS